jgi:hypothetical protein
VGRLTGSAEIPQAKSRDALEVPAVAGNEGKPVRDRGGRYERVRKGEAGLAADSTAKFSHRPVDGKLAQWREQSPEPCLIGVPHREQLRSRDHRTAGTGWGDRSLSGETIEEAWEATRGSMPDLEVHFVGGR